MKTKTKNLILFFLFILFVAGFFVVGKSRAEDTTLKITNIQYSGGTGKANEDFIEITNESDKEINLKEYRLVKRTKDGISDTTIKSWSKENDAIISPGNKYIWASSKGGEDFLKTVKADTSTGETITDGNQIALRFGKENSGEIIDSINWKKDGGDSEEEPEPETKDYSGIKINEIKAETSDEEFIEIINNSENNSIDFSQWCVKDEIKYKKTNWDCKKSSGIEQNSKFHILYGSFSLNNDSGGDAVYLYDENKNLVDSVFYKNAKGKYSYAFDGSAWHWTSQPTPGEENKFDEILFGKIIRDKKIYKGIYADFEVKADDNAQKFTWNFGDSHKSYLQKTKHKYEKSGKYQASLKITGNGEDALYEFDVEVEKYSAPKIRIASFSPNPKGSDTKNEWIGIQNKSKKKINLKNWSIASGWNKLYNHPIRENFEIKAGKTKKLSRDICAFTLNNSKTKIELRSPDGRVVQKIKYDRKKDRIEEDEIYEKGNDGWNWLSPQKNTEEIQNNTENIENEKPNQTPPPPSGEDVRRTGEGAFGNLQENYIGKSTPNPAWQKKQNYKIILASSSTNGKIKIPKNIPAGQPRVLGAQIPKSQENFYSFTQPSNEKHWLSSWTENFWEKINTKITWIINIF